MRLARPLLAALVGCSVFGVSTVALGETIAAPIGGRSVRVGSDRVVCDAGSANNGWVVDADGHGIRPPVGDAFIGQVTVLRTARDTSACSASTNDVRLVATGTYPTIDAAATTLDVDGGEAYVRGHGLRDASLHWEANGRSGDDRCVAPQSSNGFDGCSFAVARGTSADADALTLTLLPPGLHWSADLALYDAQGRHMSVDELIVRPARITVNEIVPNGVGVDTEAGVARVRLSHPEAIAAVDCSDAACDVDGSDLVIRGEHGSNDQLEMHVRLRPHVFLRTASALDPSPLITLPLQRCPVAIVSPPPLRHVNDQNIVVRIDGECARDPNPRFATASGMVTVSQSELTEGHRYAVVPIERIDGDDVSLSLLRGGSVAGAAHVHVIEAPVARVRLELANLGPIDFIPTNREARVLVAAGRHGATLEPIAVDGVYDVARDASGHATVRGVEGTAGSVSLRLAYRDRTLPASLRDLDLAVLTEPVDRQIRAANVPVSLVRRAEPLVELICGDGAGHAHAMPAGATTAIAYRARDTCRLVLHRERLRDEDGAQTLHLGVDVVESDGSPRAEVKVDQTIVLRRNPQPRVLYIAGVRAAFDRVIVRVGVASDDTHWAIAPDESTGAVALQWSIVMGTDHFRIYGTTAFPTGLFRVSDPAGIMALNVGALFRLVWLSNEGHESPVGLEAGVLWVNIANAGTASSSAFGDIAVVSGIGLSVPIANQSHATQTNINLHAWFEYEVSRSFTHSGDSFGFVFGPSISIGDVGANF